MPMPEILTREILQDAASRGLTAKEVADRNGTCIGAVYNASYRTGVFFKQRRPRILTRAIMENAASQGLAAKEVADRYGMCIDSVYRAVSRTGVSLKKRYPRIEFDASSLIDFIKSKKCVTRLQIMRRFKIPRNRCDQLLKKAMRVGDFKEHVQFQKTFGKAEWIIYSAPSSHRNRS